MAALISRQDNQRQAAEQVLVQGQQYLTFTVSAVLEIADADIEPASSFGAKLRRDYINGMGELGEKFVIVRDIDRALSVEVLAMLGGGHHAGESARRMLAAPAETQA